MNYKVSLPDYFNKILNKIPKPDRERIKLKIDALSFNPRPNGCEKLEGKQPPLYRIRVGKYRVIYAIEDHILHVLIVDIDHRKDVYK